MKTTLTFLGAAQNVTGSKYLLDIGGTRVMVDGGLYQERDLKARNWAAFPVPPNSISAVILTHAHLDHCGYLPKLVQDGFKGPIYCTPATAEIARIVMEDAAKIQEEDVRLKALRHEREQRRSAFDLKPLYTLRDAQAACGLLTPCRYDVALDIVPGLRATFQEAGHILGAASLLMEVATESGTRRIVFSGDMGRWDRPLLRDPELCPDADYVLVESTYGDRLHDGTDHIADQLADVINATRKRGGNVIIPSFAIERSHEVLYYLNQLLKENRIPHLLVFLDSPMARKVTQVFQHNPAILDEEMRTMFAAHESPFELPGLTMTATADESKAINHITGTAIVIAGSGMCTGGRIKHHLINNISRKESTVLFVGYQAIGTLGRQIMDGAKEVRILGQTHVVRAKIEALHGFSAHADMNELTRWLRGMKTAPRCVFVTHGEAETAKGFAAGLTKELGWKTQVPAYLDEVVLD